MQKSLEILKHIHELYNGDVTDEAMLMFAEKNQEKVNAWQEAFQNYALEDVLQMVDRYWTQKNNRTAPRVAQLLAMLNADKDVHRVSSGTQAKKEEKADWHTFWNIDPALGYYMRDCANKPSNEVHALLFYRRALQDIIIEKVDTLPFGAEKSYGDKIALIRINGWDGDISERADNLAALAVGRPRAEQVDGFKQAGFLASHWRA